jgi:Transposase and inactivated derivatives
VLTVGNARIRSTLVLTGCVFLTHGKSGGRISGRAGVGRSPAGHGGGDADVGEFNGETDHVHLLVHYPPKVCLSRLVGSLKGVSARRLRQEFPGHIRKYLWGDHFWSPSYFAASCGGAPLSIIKEYIENQKRSG